MFELNNKVALITGGGRGIGKGICLALAKAGADVVINYTSGDKQAQETAKLITDSGRKVFVIQADVSQKEQVEEMVNKTILEMKKIDILVNNAGILSYEPFLQMKEETFDRTIAVNLKGQFLTAQAVAKQMTIQNTKGRIINISSIASGQVGIGYPLISHYCASKGAIIALTEAMALELAPYKINVNAICPGAIESDMTKGMLENQKQMEASLLRIPKKRIGKPEDIGAMAVFLASEEADYCTGASFYVDGGYLAG